MDKNQKFEHSNRDSRNGAGENLAMHSDKATAENTTHCTDDWYSEVNEMNWESLGYASNTGHFTQVVWKGSTKLGVGVSGGIMVARYLEPGNMMGAFEANISPA